MATPDSASPSTSQMDALTYQKLHPRSYLSRFLDEGFRPDGREPHTWRRVQLNVGSITTADGSALVRLGETTILCGVKAEIASPDAMRPTHGFLVPNLDLPAMCSPRFKPGPPVDEAQVLSDRIYDLLTSSDVVPTSSLCIHPGRAVWTLYIDALCIAYDGNAFDACVLAVLAALQNTRLPKPTYDEDTQRVLCSPTERVPLQMTSLPLPCSFGVFDSQRLLADPSAFEEPLLQTLITIAIDERGRVASLYQAGSSAVGRLGSVVVLRQCIEAAKEQRKVLYGLFSNGT